MEENRPKLNESFVPNLWRKILTDVKSLFNLDPFIPGALLTWQMLAGISAAIPILALLTITFFPETPNFLVTHNKPKEAKEALQKFRGSTCNVDDELNKLMDFVVKNNCKKVHGFKGKFPQK